MDKNEKYDRRKLHEYEKHLNSKVINCKCGCGEQLRELDHWGRKREYISGHNGRKYDDPKEHSRNWARKHRQDKDNVKKDNNTSRLRCQQHKVQLLVTYGSKCTECGLSYNGSNACCFDFHHINPKNKEFNVNAATFNKYSKEKVFKEAEKCVILCANCHRLHHQLNPY